MKYSLINMAKTCTDKLVVETNDLFFLISEKYIIFCGTRKHENLVLL